MRGTRSLAGVAAAVLLLGGPGVRAEESSPRARFAAGLAAYRKGDWVAAAETFGALDPKHRSPAVQMALGNALYQQGRTGPAVLAWYRGALLDPFAEDLAHNLELVTGHPPWGSGPLGVALKTYLAPDPATLEAAVLLGLATALVGYGLLRWGRRRWGLVPTAVGLGVAGLALGWCLAREARVLTRGRAVMVALQPVVATAGPGAVPDFPRVFELRPGTPVRIHRGSGSFRQISLPTGAAGWVPREALEEI